MQAHDKYDVLLESGTMIVEATGSILTPDLRAAVINAALTGAHVQDVWKALQQRRAITFRVISKDAEEVTVRWVPPQVH